MQFISTPLLRCEVSLNCDVMSLYKYKSYEVVFLPVDHFEIYGIRKQMSAVGTSISCKQEDLFLFIDLIEVFINN